MELMTLNAIMHGATEPTVVSAGMEDRLKPSSLGWFLMLDIVVIESTRLLNKKCSILVLVDIWLQCKLLESFADLKQMIGYVSVQK